MRLAEGIVIDKEKTFGRLYFSGKRRDVFERDASGNPTDELKERTYDLQSEGAGMMIQVSIPAEAPEIEFAYEAEVELVNPIIGAVANATYRGADVSWYLKADNIILKKGDSLGNPKEQGKKTTENHHAQP